MRLVWIFIALMLLFLVPFVIWGGQFEQWFQTERVSQWLREFGSWAWLPGIVVLSADLFLPIPATAIMAALGLVYGVWWGGLISAAGSVFSGLLAYGIARGLGKRAAYRLLGRKDYRRGRRLFGRRGGWLIVLSRWMPLLPEVIACMAGLAKMPFRSFFGALLCGSIPLGFTYAIIGHSGHENPKLALMLSIFLPPLLWVSIQPLMARLSRRR